MSASTKDRVLLSVVLAQGASVRRLEQQVRDAVTPLVAGRAIDVHVADVDTGEELSAEFGVDPAGEPR